MTLRGPKIPDEVLLLAEIVIGRSAGSNDSRAGTSDEDLLYALEEAEPHLAALKTELRRP